jgi:hypothetical protein
MQACFLGTLMACRFGFIIAILTTLFAAAPANAQSGGEASGIWPTRAGDAKVRVSKCGGGIRGVVVWLKDPINPSTGNDFPHPEQRPLGPVSMDGHGPHGSRPSAPTHHEERARQAVIAFKAVAAEA